LVEAKCEGKDTIKRSDIIFLEQAGELRIFILREEKKKSKYKLITLLWTRAGDVTETKPDYYMQEIKRDLTTTRPLLNCSYSSLMAQGSKPFGARDLP